MDEEEVIDDETHEMEEIIDDDIEIGVDDVEVDDGLRHSFGKLVTDEE